MTSSRADGLSRLTLYVFLAITFGGLLGGGGTLFPPVYVAAALMAGFAAYYQNPSRFLSLVYGLWFFTPFVRRVNDWYTEYHPTNVVLLAPVLVTLIAGLTAIYRARELRGTMLSPYLFTLFAVLYGYSVGVLKSGFMPATYALLTWLGPIALAVHLTLSWRQYPVIRESIVSFLHWAIPLIAVYSIYQLVRPPSWDRFWMTEANVSSVGAPVAFGFRVFGTLNTPGPLAVVLVMGILYLLASNRRGVVLILVVAVTALMLTRVRSSWGALVVGLMIVQFMGPVRRMARNWFMLLLMLLLAFPLLSLDVFRDSITSRLQSFATLSQDNSFKQRLLISAGAANEIAARAEGEGLGATGGGAKLQEAGPAASIDNGLLEVFFVLGWPGGALLTLGLLGHLMTLARFRDARMDSFANGARATFWALLSVLLIGDIFSGGIGAVFWGTLGFASCAHAHNFAIGTGRPSRQATQRASPIRPVVVPRARA